MKRALLIFSLVLMTLPATAQINPEQGLIAYYPLDGNVADAGPYGNHGVLQGAIPTYDRHEETGRAFYFDGWEDYVKITKYSKMSPRNAVSVAAWIKTSSAKCLPIIYDRLETNDGFGLRLTENGHARIAINGGLKDAVSKGRVDDGQWHHVVGTYDREEGVIKIYVDGELAGSNPYREKITYSPEPRNCIGAFGGDLPGFYEGAIDELRIYNRALSLEEIKYICDFDEVSTTFSYRRPAEPQFELFPHPAFEEVFVRVGAEPRKALVVNIYDHAGTVVWRQESPNKRVPIDLSALPTGTYSICVVQDMQSLGCRSLIVP